MLDRGTDLLQRNAGIDKPLDHLQDQDVSEAVEALGTGSRRTPDLRNDQAGTRPIVKLSVGDSGGAARDRPAESHVSWQRRKVAFEEQPLRVRRIEAGGLGRAC